MTMGMMKHSLHVHLTAILPPMYTALASFALVVCFLRRGSHLSMKGVKPECYFHGHPAFQLAVHRWHQVQNKIEVHLLKGLVEASLAEWGGVKSCWLHEPA